MEYARMGSVQLSKALCIHAAQGNRRASGQPRQICCRFSAEHWSAGMGTRGKYWSHERKRGIRRLGR